jgi:acyl carrier protein
MATIDSRVKEAVLDALGGALQVDEVTRDASLADDLGADSLERIELIMSLEESFDIHIPDEDAEKILTVGDAIDFVKKALLGK